MMKKKDRYDSFNVRFKFKINSDDIKSIIFEYIILDTNNINEKDNTYNVYKGRFVKNESNLGAKGMLLTEHDVCPVRDNDCGLYFDDIGNHKYEKEKNVYLLNDKENYYYFFKILSIVKEIQKREDDEDGEIIDLILNMDNYVKSNCSKVDDELKNRIFEYAHFRIHIWG